MNLLKDKGRWEKMLLAVSFFLAFGGFSLSTWALANQNHAPLPQSFMRLDPLMKPITAAQLTKPNYLLTNLDEVQVIPIVNREQQTAKQSLINVFSASYSLPHRIVIPSIKVDSRLIYTGLNSDGTIQVPSGEGVDRAAWYKYSAPPGSIGTSVIEGHVDTYKSGPSVFFNLGAMKAGDMIYIKSQNSSVSVFAVYAVKLIAKNSFPTKAIYQTSVRPTLNLITCGGPYDLSSQQYLYNTVVFSRLVDISSSLPTIN